MPPIDIAGKIWHLMRPEDSAATLSHQGPITLTEAMACGFQMWWNFSVTSCAAAGKAASVAARASAAAPA